MQHTRPNVSKSGLTISERRKSSNKILNCQRSMPIVVRKINSPNRLMGGADKEPVIEQIPAKDPLSESVQKTPNPPSLSPLVSSMSSSPLVEKSLEESMQLEENSQNKQLLPTSGPCCICIPQTPELFEDRKVDEIIEYVHQNLQDAGKALATLGENFEHDLKLMFVDILGRIKQWTGIVQNKLDACKNEVNNLHKELLARACEIVAKTRELRDLKGQIADYQNGLPSNSKLPKKVPKKDELEQKEEDHPVVENARAANAKEIMKVNKMNAVKNTVRVAYEEDEEDMQAGTIKEINRIKKNARKNAVRTTDQEDEEGVQAVHAVDRIDEGNGENEEEARAVDRIDEDEDKKRAIDRTIERIDEDEEELPRRRKNNEKKMKDVTYTSTSVQTFMQEKERTKKESELESEVRRLQKERAEYESAIQRALLRGVSSLNVEALRVLRCPPMPCCTPCAPCPTIERIVPTKPIVPCPGKSTKRRPRSAAATDSSAKVSHNRNIQNNDQIDGTTKRIHAASSVETGSVRIAT